MGRMLTCATLLLLVAVQPAATGWAAPQEATPGPAARAGETVDHAWLAVRDDVTEALLATRVRIALLEHLKGDGLKVRMEIDGSRVTLRGEVTRRSSQELAEEVVKSVSGVKEVRNHITVAEEGAATKPPLTAAADKVEREVNDAWLEASVKAHLLEELGRVAFAIEVEATDGVVSLSGSVPDSARRELAVKAAKKARGVIQVHDLLRIDS